MELKDPKLFRQQCYVNGEWVDALNRGTIPVTNPATGETLGTVPRMGAEETRQAIEAADRALPGWRGKTAKERAQILRKWFDLMMANQEDLAALMTAEQGKPLAESKGEIAYAAAFIEWFGEEGKRIYGDTIPAHASDKRIVVTKEPIGVCAAITPWNFPAAMITRKCGPALAAGCTMVVKPATATPYSALALCELAERAGVPKGVFSCVTGDVEGDRRRDDLEPDRAQADLHRLDRGRQIADGAVRRHGQEDCRWNWAATRRSSSSTTPISRWRSRARSPRNTAMPARPASAPTASWCRTASTTPLPSASPRPPAR